MYWDTFGALRLPLKPAMLPVAGNIEPKDGIRRDGRWQMAEPKGTSN